VVFLRTFVYELVAFCFVQRRCASPTGDVRDADPQAPRHRACGSELTAAPGRPEGSRVVHAQWKPCRRKSVAAASH